MLSIYQNEWRLHSNHRRSTMCIRAYRRRKWNVASWTVCWELCSLTFAIASVCYMSVIFFFSYYLLCCVLYSVFASHQENIRLFKKKYEEKKNIIMVNIWEIHEGITKERQRSATTKHTKHRTNGMINCRNSTNNNIAHTNE